MAEIVVTAEHVLRAKLCDACSTPVVGALISDLTQPQLIWAERIVSTADLAELRAPLWALPSDGYGDGDGDGYGDGYGYGDGDGDG